MLHPYSWSFIPAYVLSPVLILIFTSNDGSFQDIPLFPRISQCFSPFLMVKKCRFDGDLSRSFPQSWIFHHRGSISCDPRQFFDGTKLLIETQLACDVLLKHIEVLRRFFTNGLQYMEINEDQWIWVTIYANQWRSMNLGYNIWKTSMKINEFLVLLSGFGYYNIWKV